MNWSMKTSRRRLRDLIEMAFSNELHHRLDRGTRPGLFAKARADGRHRRRSAAFEARERYREHVVTRGIALHETLERRRAEAEA